MIPAITINAYMNPTSKSYNLKCSHQKAGGLRLRLFLCLYHLLAAVDAQDVYFFGGSHAVAAAGANIFAVVAVAGRGWAFAAARRVAAARAPRGVAPLNAVHADVRPPLRQNEFAQGVGRLGDAPPDARVVPDVQVTGDGGVAELLVVVRPAPAGVLDALLHIPQVHTFVQHGGDHVFDGPVQCPRPDVQFVPGAVAPVPCPGDGHMAVGPRGTLDGYNRFLELPAEIFGI